MKEAKFTKFGLLAVATAALPFLAYTQLNAQERKRDRGRQAEVQNRVNTQDAFVTEDGRLAPNQEQLRKGGLQGGHFFSANAKAGITPASGQTARQAFSSDDYQRDNGMLLDAIGTGSAPIVWWQTHTVAAGLEIITDVSVEVGTDTQACDGLTVEVGVLSDPNGDGVPDDGVLLGSASAAVTGSGNGDVQKIALGAPIAVGPAGTSFFLVAAMADVTGCGFPSTIDSDAAATPLTSWIGIGLITDPPGAILAGPIEALVFPGNWMLRGNATADAGGCKGTSAVISEIADATLPGGLPKFVELSNPGCEAVDMSCLTIGNYSNGGTTLGGGESTVLTGTLNARDSYIVAYEFPPAPFACTTDKDCLMGGACSDGACPCDSEGCDDGICSGGTCISTFEDVYGFAPDFHTGPFLNGDDVIALFVADGAGLNGEAQGDGSDATLVDLYGEIGVDGTGTCWDHVDGHSNRLCGVGPSTTFDCMEWELFGPNSLETGDDVTELALIQANTSPGSWSNGLPPVACENAGCPEPNDACAGRLDITDGVTAYDSTGATTDGLAHVDCQFDGQTYNDLWWNYTATCTGELTVSTCNTAAYDTDLVVYDGCDLCPPTDAELAGCNDDTTGCAGFSSLVVIPVVEGNCYKIRTGGFNAPDAGAAELNVECAAAGGGACCLADASCVDAADKAACAGLGGTYSGDGTDCTQDIICTGACCDGAGGCTDTSEEACAGDFQGAGTDCATADCEVGGDNNNCADRISIFDGDTDFDTTMATTDGLPHAACQFDGQTYNDIWYNYDSTCTGTLTVSTCGTAAYDTDVVIYDGCELCPPTDAELLGCNDDFTGCAGFSSIATADVSSGNCYKIRLGGFNAPDAGTGTVNISCEGGEPVGACCESDGTCTDGTTKMGCTDGGGEFQGGDTDCATTSCPPANDDCIDRQVVTDGNTPFTNIGATTDGPVGDAACSGDDTFHQDVWFNYTATCTGVVNANTCEEVGGSADFDTKIGVYDGCSCDPLGAQVGCNDDSGNPCGSGGGGFHSEALFSAVEGNCYKIRIGGWSDGEVGSGELNISCTPSGACCDGFVCSVVNNEAECTDAGGTYLGDGSVCAGNPCFDPGICPISDCDTGMTQSADMTTDGGNVACGIGAISATTENSWARCFDLNAELGTSSATLNSVTWGVSQASVDQDVAIRVYDAPDCVAPSLGTAVLLSETIVVVGPADEGNPAIVTAIAPTPVNGFAIVEIESLDDGTLGQAQICIDNETATCDGGICTGDGVTPCSVDADCLPSPPCCDTAVGGEGCFQFRAMSNATGQCGLSYLRADDCGITDWITTDSIGFPDEHLIMTLDVTCPECGDGIVEGNEECDGGGCCNEDCTLADAGSECNGSMGPCDVAETCPGSLLANGAFDDNGGSLDGWIVFGNNVFTDVGIFNSAPASLKIFGEFNGGFGFGGVVQRFPAAPGQRYTATATANNFSGDAMQCDNFVVLKIEGCQNDVIADGFCDDAGGSLSSEVQILNVNSPLDTWVAYSVAHEMAAGVQSVGAAIVFVQPPANCGGSGFIDDVTLTPHDCPPDGVEDAGTVCDMSGGPCEEDAECDGVGVDCPDNPLLSGNVCSQGDGACVQDALCDGSGAACPPNDVTSACVDGDGCCPAGAVCNANEDNDCDPICGNGVQEPGEGCDDGNDVDGDGCTACTVDPPSVPAVTPWGMAALIFALVAGLGAVFGRRRD